MADEEKVETNEDLKIPVVKSEDEANEARTLTPREQKQVDERAALEAELFAEPSNTDETKGEQATDEGTQPAKETSDKEETVPPEKAEDKGKEADEVKAEDVAEPVEFAKLFPGGLEVPLPDGAKIVVTSEQDLIDRLAVSERKEIKDRLNWEKSLMARGQKTNEGQAQLLAERKAFEQERDRLRKLEVDVERARNTPVPPVKPNEALNDPENNIYNPVLYRQQREAYDGALPGYVQKSVAAAVKRATAPPPVDVIAQAGTAGLDAQNGWITAQVGMTPEVWAEIDRRAEPKFAALLTELQAENDILRPRDVINILNGLKAEVLAEAKTAKAQDLAIKTGEGVKQTMLRSLARAKDGNKPSKATVAAQSEVDPFDDSVSMEDFGKLARSGKIYN